MHGLQTCCCCFIPHLCSVVVVKLLLKGEVGVCVLNSHGNDIVDHGTSWKNHGIMFFEFLWEPCSMGNLVVLSVNFVLSVYLSVNFYLGVQPQ